MGAKCKNPEAFDWPPTIRAFDLTRRVLLGERISADRIVALYGVGARQAYRLVQALSATLPIIEADMGEKGGIVYEIIPEYKCSQRIGRY